MLLFADGCNYRMDGSSVLRFRLYNLAASAIAMFILGRAATATAASYFVDADSGSDANSGTAPASAWKSLEKVNGVTFAPGDTVAFKCGTQYQGQLWPKGSGAAGRQITIQSYDHGEAPRVDGGGAFTETVKLLDQQYWTIGDLEITNTGAKRGAGRCGVQIKIAKLLDAHEIVLRGLYVHDVNGSLVKIAGGGGGISVVTDGDGCRYDNLLIENCHVVTTDRDGIIASGGYSRSKWNPNLNVVIRDNLLENIGGDGILVTGADGALIEHNVLRGGRMRCADAAAGIWPWSSDNTVIQFNEVSGMKGVYDGEAFDADWNCRNTIIQYNYSHDNDGGAFLACNSGGKKKDMDIGNLDAVFRYNISQNDGRNDDPNPKTKWYLKRGALWNIAGPVKRLRIYNNTFYTGSRLQIVAQCSNWGGFPDDVEISNNIFYVESGGQLKFWAGKATNVVFRKNCMFGAVPEGLPDGKFKFDPMLINPGAGANGFASLAGYGLQKRSPALECGESIEQNGGRDFVGVLVSGDAAPFLGAVGPRSSLAPLSIGSN
jgi:hypothetical protein